jgi:hypothetical protein
MVLLPEIDLKPFSRLTDLRHSDEPQTNRRSEMADTTEKFHESPDR